MDRTVGNCKMLLGGILMQIGRVGEGYEGEDGEKKERIAKDETINGE